MKIVMLCEFFDETLEFQENLAARHYRKHGHGVTVITSAYSNIFEYYRNFDLKARKLENPVESETIADDGTKIIKLPFRYNFFNRFRPFRRLDGILQSEAPDLIFVHSVMPNLPDVVRHLKRNPGCKGVLDYHGSLANSGNNPLSRWLLHKVVRGRQLRKARPYLSRIFPVTPAGIEFLHQIYGVGPDEMELLPLGADLDQIKEEKANGARAKIRAGLGIGDEDIAVFFGGKFEPRKKLEVLLEAIKQIGNPRLHAIMVGDCAPEHAEYKARIMEMAEPIANLHFTGWLGTREVYAHLAAADIAAFPASQSIIWQQAIAAGLPLIAGDTGHQSIEYLNLHQNIVVLDKDDITPVKVANAISEIINDPARRMAMSAGAERVGAEELDWNVLIGRTLRFCPGWQGAAEPRTGAEASLQRPAAE